VWCSPGRNAATLQAFFAQLGKRRQTIRAVWIDMSGGYEKTIREAIPDAEVAFDPFHVLRLAQRAVDQVRRDEWNAHDRSHTETGKWIKNTRWSLLKAPDKQSIRQLAVLGEVQQANKPMFRAFLLKEELRLLYALEDPTLAPAHLDAWLAWASRSRLAPFLKLARTIRRHQVGIPAAIRLGRSNGRLKASTAASASSATAASASTAPHHSSPPSTCAAHRSSSISRDEPSPTNRPEHRSSPASVGGGVSEELCRHDRIGASCPRRTRTAGSMRR
jgi:hypothetical protein